MKKILVIFFLLIFSSNLNAQTIYLNCEEVVNKVRESSYGGLYTEGEVIGNIFLRIKKKVVDVHFAYSGGKTFDLIINKKFKKTNLGFTVKDQYKDNQFKSKEFLEFIKPMDDYVFKRTSYFWSAETSTDGEDLTDYDGSGRCQIIEKKEYLRSIKNR